MRNQRKLGGAAWLQPGERYVSSYRPAWRHFTRYLVFPLASLLIMGGTDSGIIVGFSFGVTMAACVYGRYSNRYWITSQRVIVEEGIWVRNVSQSCISDLQLVEFRQNFIDRVLNCGSVYADSAAHSSIKSDIVFSAIANPHRVKELIFSLKYGKSRRRGRRRHSTGKRR